MPAQASTQSLEEKIVHAIELQRGYAKLKDVLTQFNTSERAAAELKIMSMAKSGILVMQKEYGSYILSIKSKPVNKSSIAHAANEQPKLEEQPLSDQIATTATIPFSIQSKRDHDDGELKSTAEAFSDLLSRATRSIRLSLPFPEEPIIVHFTRQLTELSKRRVKVNLLTREISTTPSSFNEYHYATLIKSILRMWDIYRVHNGAHLFEVREFHHSVNMPNSKPVHYESTHAKILSVDGTQCYVGSAEFRVNSLYNNFELGFVVTGKTVSQVDSVFDLVWRNAKPIQYASLNRHLQNATNREWRQKYEHRRDRSGNQ